MSAPTDEERLAAIRARNTPHDQHHTTSELDDEPFLLSIIDRLKAERDVTIEMFEASGFEVDALRARVAKLEAAGRLYVGAFAGHLWHAADCRASPPSEERCSCGADAFVAALDEGKVG